MAAAAPVVIGAAFSGWSAAAFVGFSWAAFAGSLILGGLSYALTPKPKKLDTEIQNQGQLVAVRQSDLTRQYLYGHTRITRGYAHMESTGQNGNLHMVLMLCEGPIRAINEVWINDYCIPNDWLDSEGNVIEGRYKGFMQIRKHLGTESQAADPVAVANMEFWTNAHKLSGIAYLYIVMDKDQDVFPTGVPNVSAVVEGREIYDPREGTSVWSGNIALLSHDFIRNDGYGFGAFADDIDEINVAAQANICDEIVDTTFEVFEVASVNAGTDIITLDGDILSLQFGDRVEVSSNNTLPGGLSPNTPYYVIPYQVLTTPRILLAATFEDSLNKIAIDITSEGSGEISVTKTGEPRYHGAGVVDTETPLSDTLNALVSSMAGRAINTGGFWTLLAGAWRTPDIDLGIEQMRGSGYGVKNALSMGESFNVLNGLFTSGVNLYQSSNYPSVRYQAFIDQDNGLESPKELNLVYTNRPTTAQRIAKIELFRGRQDIVFTSDFSMDGITVKPGDNVTLTVDRLGWNKKPFEVTLFSFMEESDKGLKTRLTLRETAQQIFDWSAGEAIDYDPAPNTNLTNPFLVTVPAGVSYNSRFIETRDGDLVFALTLNWNLHTDAFVREFGDFEIQYKLSSETDWRPSFFVDGHQTNTDVVNNSANVYYDLRIRARNNVGVRSGWVTINNAIVGSSGGVGSTEDWETFSDPIVYYEDWETFSDPVGSGEYEDWGFFS